MNTNTISQTLSVVQRFGTLLLILSTLFLFANQTTEFFDTPKFLGLMVFLAVLLILSALKNLSEGKVILKITPLSLPLLVLLVVAIVSTLLSSSVSTSIGNLPQVNGTLAAWGALILLYFLLVHNLQQNDYGSILNTLLGSGIILATMSLLTFLGVKILPFNFAQGLNFTPTGSSFSTTAVLVLLLPFLLNNILSTSTHINKTLSAAVLTLFSMVIALTGVWATYIGAGVAILLTLTLHRSGARRFYPYLLVPLALVTLVAAVSFLPNINTNSPLRKQAQNFPREVQLPFIPSWKIAASSFRDSPFWGSGPATTLFNFTIYKPIELNQTNLWNIRFKALFNEYLGILGTLGGLGLLAFAVITIQYLKSALASRQLSAVAISGLLFFILLALHPATLVLWVIGIVILVLFYIVNDNLTKSVHLRLGAGGSNGGSLSGDSRQALLSGNSRQALLSFDVFPLLLFLIILGLVGVAEFFTGKYLLADYYHRQALAAVAANNGRATYDHLVTAEKLNPYNDLYRTDLAQTNFALANAIASAKGPTEASPAGSLTDQDKKTIQQLLQQAIAEGRAATVLSPKSTVNWEILGSIYRQISGVATNGLQFSLDAYGRAIQLDPLNPLLRLNVGGIYYSIRSYDLAIRFFTDAINLKPDYANGYYNLSVALRDKGDLKNAQAVGERLISLVNQKSPDYKLASDYLSDLKARIATGSAQESAISAPAAQTGSSLQKPGEPILNLPKPENIATPPAIKK
ncbi:MAG: O-antigen ligase family protein [Candidatus Daviesbacteria bacterium]|nr:MAG: O-antigen ligase family protein [Candidatus Daviesbacteria bacterium]